MSTDGSQLVERLAWEGVVSGRTALLLFVAIALLAAWSLWRERNVVGRRWAIAFWLLRLAAFGCALWMLAGPTRLKINRTTINQSIAIFADGSDSMEVVDPPDPSDSLRWRLAIDGPSGDSAVVRCDRLGVALGDALSSSRRLADMVKEHRPPKQLAALVTSIAATVDRASNHVDELIASLDGPERSLAERAERIATLVDGPVDESLDAIRTALDEPEQMLSDDFAVRLEQLVEGLASARRRTSVFVADLAQAEAGAATNGRAEIDGLSRREKAGRALDALEGEIRNDVAENVHVNRFRFDHTATPVGVGSGWVDALTIAPPDVPPSSAEADAAADREANSAVAAGPSTNLTAVLEKLANQRSGEATRLAVILSDGRHNDVDAPAPQEVATQLAHVPVYVVPIGNSVEMRDVLLHRVEAPSAVAQNDEAVIDVIVTGFDCDGLASHVVLRHDGREVDRKPVEFIGGRGDQRVRFMVKAKELGWQEYVVEVEPVDEETNTANNFQPVSFEVVRDRMRILLADGIARWEYRYLNQLFRRDQHVQFDELLFYPRLHGTGRLAARPEFPRDVDGWSRYDIVILGDVTPQQLSAESQRGLVDFVRTRGGNLIVVAGHNGMPGAYVGEPLMDLLPVEPARNFFPQQGYTLRLTEEGRFQSALLVSDSPTDSRAAWRKVYQRHPVFELSEYCRPKSTARTLIEAVSQAAGDVGIGRELDAPRLAVKRARFRLDRLARERPPR